MSARSSSVLAVCTAPLLAGFAALVVARAWLCDDAYITFRTVDNFLAGYGLRWNVAERVQSYTHPLWMFVLSGAVSVTHEFYYTSLALGVGLSVAAVAVVALGVAETPLVGALAVAAFTGSRAFVDYSTSGLENALAHLLLALFVWQWLRRGGGASPRVGIVLLFSLVALNRLDHALLCAPALLTSLRGGNARSIVAALALGAWPLVLWEGFSLLYYGSFLPNTAYAKLGTGIETTRLMAQGLRYLEICLRLDPLTFLTIVLGLLMPWTSRDSRGRALSVGIAVYLLYVIRIGGDFMAGRFLSAPFLVAVALLAHGPARPPRLVALVGGSLALLLALWGQIPQIFVRGPVVAARYYAALQLHGVADERLYYRAATGLFRETTDPATPDHPHVERGKRLRRSARRVEVVRNAGFTGFYAGRGVHIVDLAGLSDPLLARLPAERLKRWRIGHHWRHPPAGYLESLRTGENRLEDSALRAYYEHVRRVTRGPLLSWARVASIWTLHRSAPRRPERTRGSDPITTGWEPR